MGAHERRWRLVCYDVSDPRRYRKVHKIVRAAGHPVQYSVFRCLLDEAGVERLRWRLAAVMDPDTDRLLVLDLCARCAAGVISKNHVEGWHEHLPTVMFAGPDGLTQGPAPGVKGLPPFRAHVPDLDGVLPDEDE